VSGCLLWVSYRNAQDPSGAEETSCFTPSCGTLIEFITDMEGNTATIWLEIIAIAALTSIVTRVMQDRMWPALG
jgi:hypothetical protein